MNYITQIDTELLLLINSLHCNILDKIMLAYTNKMTWIPLYATLIAIAVLNMRHHPRTLIIFILCMAATITVSDQLCGHIIRDAIGRMRPSNPDNPISNLLHIVNNYRSGKFGFPSCHAANTFALATALHFVFKNKSLNAMMVFWALLNCYTRLYLGVHYPGDIVAGAIIGTLSSILIFGFISWENKHLNAQHLLWAYTVLMLTILTAPFFYK